MYYSKQTGHKADLYRTCSYLIFSLAGMHVSKVTLWIHLEPDPGTGSVRVSIPRVALLLTCFVTLSKSLLSIPLSSCPLFSNLFFFPEDGYTVQELS